MPTNLPKISLSRNQLIIIGGAVAIIVIVFTLFSLASKKTTTTPVSLTVWGTDSDDAFKPIISAYQALRPNVTVTYKQVATDYDNTVITALASGKGPDVFLIGNHDLLSRGDLLSAAPPTQVAVSDLQALFPQAVIQDFTYGSDIYALPLYMDTLALVYNKEMFDQAGVATPPATWQDVLDIIPRLRTLDANGQITRAGLAVGGSEKSVDHATDILNLVMLQNGTTMADDNGKPRFSRNEGVAAFQFYLQFADAGSPAYTWNDSMQGSLESFVAQKAAMALVYQSDLDTIRKQAPFLDFAVTAAPQTATDKAVNYPSYRGLAVWTGSKVKTWDWDFVIFATTNTAAQTGYLKTTGHPAALRPVIATQQTDADLAVFAKAALTARSWKMGDYDKIKTIFTNAIQNVLTGAKNPSTALGDAEAQAGRLVSQ